MQDARKTPDLLARRYSAKFHAVQYETKTANDCVFPNHVSQPLTILLRGSFAQSLQSHSPGGSEISPAQSQ